MTVSVRFFASVRERLGIAFTTVDVHDVKNVRDLWEVVTDEPLDATILVAVNKTYADVTHPVKDGDEVAFFPPITGG